ncbi:MAG: nitric oxide reductase NorE protein [Kiritimatiellia bacterium]|jgi:nitric oxide reductase NorE protein|tara:strand:- start:94 stop:696 length:603 start_codon:yes stop_codon:yes gene_type:complete
MIRNIDAPDKGFVVTTDSPGNETIWMFILGDMCVFSLFFFYYLYVRNGSLELFQESQTLLNLHYGSMNTLILLASSWFMVIAVIALRKGNFTLCRRFTGLAFLCGVFFSILKVFEYREKMQAGISFDSNDFFIFYYMLTGIHFLHLVLGLCVLAYLWYFALHVKGSPTDDQFTTFEFSAIYWHMVDLLWILIFPLLYLLP